MHYFQTIKAQKNLSLEWLESQSSYSTTNSMDRVDATLHRAIYLKDVKLNKKVELKFGGFFNTGHINSIYKKIVTQH